MPQLTVEMKAMKPLKVQLLKCSFQKVILLSITYLPE